MNRLLRYVFTRNSSTTIPLVNVVRMEGGTLAVGLISSSRGVRGPQARRIISMERVEPWLLRAFMPGLKTLRPVAVAISLNSPGGSAAQAELIHHRIRTLAQETKTPVFTFAEDIAASGGYWLMCAGDELYATSTSLVGSIGVISTQFGFVEIMKRLGLERRVYKAGDAKDLLDPFRPVRPEDESIMQEMLQDLHSSFQDTVRSARGAKLDLSKQGDLWSGRAWTGRQAAALGLVDGVSTLEGKMRERYGNQVYFMQCGEPPRAGLLDALGIGSSMRAWWTAATGKPPDAYALSSHAAQAVLDELDYRTLMARYGL